MKKDHPRTCGEKFCFCTVIIFKRGSPPHMRGKVDYKLLRHSETRITPAHAGKRHQNIDFTRKFEDHPRTCGEKRFVKIENIIGKGSPPHMRGKVISPKEIKDIKRITPAHAGKSVNCSVCESFQRDHPRTCGEKHGYATKKLLITGSPPHMRGKALSTGAVRTFPGITPAHAGKRLITQILLQVLKDHPRTCGEKGLSTRKYLNLKGSPPHMRGKD